jgi:hypothetical protein
MSSDRFGEHSHRVNRESGKHESRHIADGYMMKAKKKRKKKKK